MTTSFSKLLIHHLHKWWSVFLLMFLHTDFFTCRSCCCCQWFTEPVFGTRLQIKQCDLEQENIKGKRNKKSQSTPILTDDSYFDFDLCCFWFEVLRKQPNVTVCVGRLLMVSCCQECRLPYAQIAHSHRNTSCCVSGLKPVNTHLFHPSAQKHVEQAIEQRA